MRQAGRSLPEYRAIRERHSFFEVARTPELCAEVTLQPVAATASTRPCSSRTSCRRSSAMGIDVELVEGVGPVVDEPIVSRADVERLRVPRRRTMRRSSRRSGSCARELAPEKALIGFCGAPFTVAGYLVEGKPSRDFAKTKALMYREPDTWHALLDVLTEQFARYVAAQAARRRRRHPALRLVGRRALAGRLRRVRRAVLRAHPRRGRRADDPLRHGHRRAAARLARAGGDVIGVDWRLPLARPRREDRAVQGNLDPAALLGPWERIEAAARDVLERGAGRPHIFNLGHGVLPQTDPAAADASWPRSSQDRSVSRGVSERRRGRPDGLWLARAARGRPRVLRRHPRRPADRAGEPRRSGRALPPPRRRGLEPAERDHRGDARRARARARPARLHGDEALDAAHCRRRRARARRRTHRRPRARAALQRALDQGLPRPARAGARRPRQAPLRRELARRRRVPRRARRQGPRHRRPRRLHRALAAGADPRDGRSVPRPAARDRAARRRARGRDGLVVLLPERVADGRALARPRHPRPPTRPACAGRAQGARLPGRLRLRPSRDPLGYRRRGAGARAGARARAVADRDAQ